MPTNANCWQTIDFAGRFDNKIKIQWIRRFFPRLQVKDIVVVCHAAVYTGCFHGFVLLGVQTSIAWSATPRSAAKFFLRYAFSARACLSRSPCLQVSRKSKDLVCSWYVFMGRHKRQHNRSDENVGEAHVLAKQSQRPPNRLLDQPVFRRAED